MIPEEVVRELRYIEVSTARKMRNPRVGQYTSRLRGPGFDFDEHQPYRPGDDVRRIDWNVTARMDAPFVRLTHAERELTMMIAIDVSRSMELGTAHFSKRETMMFITASLLFSALANQINTGFLAFSDQVIASSPPRRTRAAAWAVLQQCWSAQSHATALESARRGSRSFHPTALEGARRRRGRGRTALAPMVHHLLTTLRRMSIVFLVSDFITDDDGFGSRELAMLAARHDVIAIVPEDRSERELPAGPGYWQVRDLETGRHVAVDLGVRSRELYAAEARRRRDRLVEAFYRVPLEYIFVSTDQSPVEPVLSFFARRIAR
jgi:uncharacterized protein (DUF58 family)